MSAVMLREFFVCELVDTQILMMWQEQVILRLLEPINNEDNTKNVGFFYLIHDI